jgi:hypothetical protein
MDKSNKPVDEVRFINSYFTSDKWLITPIRVGCKFDLDERKTNIKYAMSLGIPQITEIINKYPEDAVIIGGGPSVNQYADKIKKLQKNGAKVYSIERMYKWCLNHGIVPDFVVAMDASDDVMEGFRQIHDDTTHILLAQCKPEVFDLLKDKKVYYFLVEQKGVPYSKYCEDYGINQVTMINAGGSVVLGAISIAITLGSKNFHIFGFDCHITDGNYCKGITGIGDIKNVIEVEINDKVFNTTPEYLAFMQQFFQLYGIAKELGQMQDVRVYGNSMCKVASKIDIDGDKPWKGKQ